MGAGHRDTSLGCMPKSSGVHQTGATPRQCLGQRMADTDCLRREVGGWEARRNMAGSRIDWRFTTADARIKLKHLYPITCANECGRTPVSEDWC
jgi:hypothetical protein